MTNFTQLLSICKEINNHSAAVIDDFLMNYVAGREGLEREMDLRLARFRDITKGLQ